jgi:hypothetical protein
MPRLEISPPLGAHQVEWPFLNLYHPSEAKTLQHRKRVRSCVTKQQHKREQALAFKGANSYPPETDAGNPQGQRLQAAIRSFNHPPFSELSSSGHSSRHGSQGASDSTAPCSSPTAYCPQYLVDLNGIPPESWHSYVPLILVRSNGHV